MLTKGWKSQRFIFGENNLQFLWEIECFPLLFSRKGGCCVCRAEFYKSLLFGGLSFPYIHTTSPRVTVICHNYDLNYVHTYIFIYTYCNSVRYQPRKDYNPNDAVNIQKHTLAVLSRIHIQTLLMVSYFKDNLLNKQFAKVYQSKYSYKIIYTQSTDWEQMDGRT